MDRDQTGVDVFHHDRPGFDQSDSGAVPKRFLVDAYVIYAHREQRLVFDATGSQPQAADSGTLSFDIENEFSGHCGGYGTACTRGSGIKVDKE